LSLKILFSRTLHPYFLELAYEKIRSC